MAKILEAVPDKDFQVDQINKINPNDIIFNMEEYDDYKEKQDKIPREEKLKYKELNKKYIELRIKIEKLDMLMLSDGVLNEDIWNGDRDLVQMLDRRDQLVNDGIRIDKKGGGHYILCPYTTLLFYSRRPCIFVSRQYSKDLTPEEYESMLKNVEGLYKKKTKAYGDYKNQRDSHVNDLINSD